MAEERVLGRLAYLPLYVDSGRELGVPNKESRVAGLDNRCGVHPLPVECHPYLSCFFSLWASVSVLLRPRSCSDGDYGCIVSR